ncbi:Pleckstrin y domain-containing G member 5 [Bulinus truncatus]|nr:Pleckstrin y domain-containing G member 5 [Bulinus truncatus]
MKQYDLAIRYDRIVLVDRERQDQLNEILNRYSSSGLPPLPALLAIDRPNFDESMFALELNWRLLVDGDEGLPKTQQEHQEAVWELLHTEVSYIKQIRVIIDVFRNCLINIQNEGFLNDIETERLFSNVDKIYECNCIFWQKYLLPVLIISREYKKPLDPLICKNGFVEHFPQLFEVYFKYFIEHKACLDYAKSCTENSDLFKSFIMWAEAQKPCNRLKMADILVKPMQRLLKYSLLLQAILKHTENENEKAELKEMIQSVDKLCSAANNSLQRREEYEKLEAVKNIIDPFDSIEAPNDECAKIIQEYSNNFSLLAPITGFRESFHRDLLFQASLKMKDTQKSESVECFLFTDLILICKSKKTDKYKMIKPPMRLDQIVVSDLKDKGSFLLIYMNEYRVPTSACTFHSDVGAIKVFLDKFRDAQKKFKNRKLQDTLISERKVAGSVTTEDNDITTLSSVPSDQNIASFPRSESADSADQFLPNLTTPGDLPSDMVLGLGHSGSTGDIQSRSSLPGHKDLIHINTDPKMSSSTDSFLCEVYADGSSVSMSTKHRQVTSCRSFPNITVGQSNNSSDSSLQKTINDSGVCNDSENINSLQCSLTSHSAAQLSEQCSVDLDLSKQKLNARRVSRTEKRYLTADSIQELKNTEKDSTIHKRLSWRTDLDQSRNIGSKVLSTDSIGSFPSSSGVSSTASLHLNPESDITEEIEYNSGGHKIFSVGGTDDLDNGDDYTDDEMSSQSKSRTNPDIITKVSSLHVSEMKDGIASVAVDSIQHKLTPADIMKFKKLKHQVLDDANIESSEV